MAEREGQRMPRKRYSDEDILKLLREIELNLADGGDVNTAFRIVNIGKMEPESHGDFIAAIYDAFGRKTRRNLIDMQPGDVPLAWSETRLLEALTGKTPITPLSVGLPEFVTFYKDHHGVA